jgi:hypothetical protein
VTFITRDAPLPIPDCTLPRHSVPYRLIARRCIQGTLSSIFSSPNTQGWLRSIENAIIVLKSVYPSGLPSTMKQTVLPNCTSNPAFIDPVATLVCDAVSSHYDSAYAARAWPKRYNIIDIGTNYYVFLAACSTGDRAFMQQTLQLLVPAQRNRLRYLSGITAFEGWQEAFRFLSDEGYDANQHRGATVVYLPKPPPLIAAVGTGRIEFLQLILEYPCGLIKTGKTYEAAIRMALNMKDRSNGDIMADLLFSHGHNLAPREEFRESYKPTEDTVYKSKTGHLLSRSR